MQCSLTVEPLHSLYVQYHIVILVLQLVQVRLLALLRIYAHNVLQHHHVLGSIVQVQENHI